jgi:WD40 repeat protein
MITNGASEMDAKFSPDSRWLVCSGADGAEIHDARSGALLRRLVLNQSVVHVDISPDGQRVVACGEGRAVVWDANAGTPLYPAIESPSLDYVEFSHDGQWFLIRSSHTQIKIYETETGRQFGPTLTTSWGVDAAFNPDNRSLVVGSDNGAIELWSLPEGHRLEKTMRHKDVVWTARFNQNGKLLLTASRDRTAALWDAHTGTLLREFRHEQQVYSAAFSPDGTRIVTGDASRKAHVWDVQTGKRLFSLPAHPGGVWYGEFSSDGRLLLTGDDTGNARLWEASSGLPLSGWIHNGHSLRSSYFSPDGRMAISSAANGTLRLWPVVVAPSPAPTWLPELAEALAGHRLRDDGSPEPVPAERWQALSESLSSLKGDDFYARWSRWFLVERMKPNPPEFK